MTTEANTLNEPGIANARRIVGGYTPGVPTLDELIAAVNSRLREIHATGSVVLVSADELCRTGEHPLPQLRVDVRRPGDAESRPEAVDG